MSDQGYSTEKMEKYRCRVCNYVYDPYLGSPEHGYLPGTKFQELPPDWRCPECGVGKNEFEKIGENY